MQRFMPADAKAWGGLVKAWTKGTQARPKTIDELKDQMTAAGIPNVHQAFPSFITGLVFVQNDKHILTIRLPSKEQVEASETNLAAGAGGYPLPPFYDDFYQNSARRTNLTPDEKKELNDKRIGEYSVNSCK
ncbi:MAG: hypothetical protein R3D67_09925 [Hyphomicrobiaceae bacterium]